MLLDKTDRAILDGEEGETRQEMMEILVTLAKISDAKELTPVKSVQISGASYKTIGEWGLDWLSGLDAKATVPAVLNPVGMDRERWKEMGINREFAENQNRVIKAYERLGIQMECTCAPYYLKMPGYANNLAWSESSAVCYANSVIGARTNREGGPSALAAAIIGKTPLSGLHETENRFPVLNIEVDNVPEEIKDTSWFGALGYIAGKAAGNKIPIFTGFELKGQRQSCLIDEQLKSLGAAMAATGATALYHMQDVTPETKMFKMETEGLKTVNIDGSEVATLFSDTAPDAVALGCPHCSTGEIEMLVSLLEGKTVQIPLFIFAGRTLISRNADAVRRIEATGARVFADTCMVVSPALDKFGTIMVNSGKAYSYVPNMCGAKAVISTTKNCIDAACSKR